MELDTTLATLGTGTTLLMSGLSFERASQTLLLILGIAGAVLTLICNIVKLVHTFHKAKEDGKIDEKEKEALKESLKDIFESMEDVAIKCEASAKGDIND